MEVLTGPGPTPGPGNHRIRAGFESVIFLYRLGPGVAKGSFGLHCARLAGLPDELLQRAAHVLSLQSRRLPVPRFALRGVADVDRVCEEVVERLASLDVDNGDVHSFIAGCFELLDQDLGTEQGSYSLTHTD